MIIVLNKVLIKKQTHFCTIYNNNNKIIQLKHSKDIILLSFLCIIAPEGSFVASRSGDRTAKIIHQQQQRHLQMRLPGMRYKM